MIVMGFKVYTGGTLFFYLLTHGDGMQKCVLLSSRRAGAGGCGGGGCS